MIRFFSRAISLILVAALAGCLTSFSGSLAAEPKSKPGGDKATVADSKITADDYPQVALPEALSGKHLCLAEACGDKATVLICLATDCPISDEFVPTINRIAEAYAQRGVNFIGIDPNGADTLDLMATYAGERKLPFPFVKDEGGKVSRRLLFSVTPEARVFDSSGKLVYSGRIDDRYRRGGTTDADVARDLENALDEVLAGKPVSASRTKAIGCPIQIVAPRAQ